MYSAEAVSVCQRLFLIGTVCVQIHFLHMHLHCREGQPQQLLHQERLLCSGCTFVALVP